MPTTYSTEAWVTILVRQALQHQLELEKNMYVRNKWDWSQAVYGAELEKALKDLSDQRPLELSVTSTDLLARVCQDLRMDASEFYSIIKLKKTIE